MDELAESLLTTADGGEHHAANRAVGRGQRRLGDPEQDVLLAADALERVDQLLRDLLLRARADAMDRRVNRSTSVSVISRSRSRNNAASSVNRSASGWCAGATATPPPPAHASP